MTEAIVQLRGDEFDEAMAFLNMVFGEHAPHDFERLLPSVYRPTDEHMANNYAMRVDGQLRSNVGMFPITWKVGDATLRVAGIGGVATHPEARGKGYMRALMEHCVARMKEQDFHLSWLGGQRQRYLYFGYEKCGSGCHFNLNKANLRHSFIGRPSLRFEPLEETQSERLRRAVALHDDQPAHAVRAAADFYKYLVCWYHRPWAAIDGKGAMVGYLVAGDSGDQVMELVADDDATALEMVKAWTTDHCEGSASFGIHPWAVRHAQLLARYCETMSVGSTGNWQVLDWPAVGDAVMKLRRRCAPMAEGEVVLEVEGTGVLRLWVSGGEAGCQDAKGARVDLTCNAPTAMRVLFGPLKPSSVCDLPAGAVILESWCPLPLSWARQDGV